MREPLEPGTIITVSSEGSDRKYQIDRIIGEGASGIAYDAHRIGVSNAVPRCRIKECYPAECGVKRAGNELLWTDSESKDAAFERLKNAHKIMVELRDDASVGNNITSAELCEGNGTLYSVMEVNHAISYARDKEKQLAKILDSIKHLTKVVGCVHKKGYLHLDIKPDNFLITYKPNTAIWLFDMDSLISLENIKKEDIQAIPYTEGYGAPEQAYWHPHMLSPATDIYSIGAILFEKIMNRKATCSDRGIFARWDFEDERFDVVNPQIKRQLAEIFSKTLAAYPEARYQSADQLLEALEATKGLLREPYLASNYPVSSSTFVGREDDLEVIEEAFSTGEHIVFLQGIGGIGKSELAKQYAKLHEKEYDAVMFAHYDGSVGAVLDNLPIQDYSGEQAERRKCIINLLNENVLLIIDGYDQENDDDHSILEQLRCHILVTSRVDWGEYGVGQSIEINALPVEQQVELFEQEYGNPLDQSEKKMVEQLFADVEGYTLLIPLLAKQMAKGYLDFTLAKARLSGHGLKGLATGKLRHQKDGKQLSGSVLAILRDIFTFAQFTEEQRTILRSLVFLDRYQIEQATFLQWVGYDQTETIDDLCFQGWIRRDVIDKTVYLDVHAVIADLLSDELKPTISNCTAIKNSFLSFAEAWKKHKRALSADEMLGQRWDWGYPDCSSYDKYRLGSYAALFVMLLNKTDRGNIEDILIWVDIIEKLIQPDLKDIQEKMSLSCNVTEEFRRFLLNTWTRPDTHQVIPVEYRAKLALALEKCEMAREDFREALRYAQYLSNIDSEVSGILALQFHACFSLLELLNYGWERNKNYKKVPGFDEIASFLKSMLEQVLKNFDLLEVSEILVISNKTLQSITREQLEDIYCEFCRKVLGEKCGEDPFEMDEDEVCYEPASKPVEREETFEEEQDAFFEVFFDGKKELVQHASFVADSILELLPYHRIYGVGNWEVFTTEKLEKYQKQALEDLVHEVDQRIPYVNGAGYLYPREMGAMEAAYTYACACIEDWDGYAFHSNNLVMYYEDIMKCDSNPLLPVLDDLGSILMRLPGLGTLTNRNGDAIPYNQVLLFYDSVIEAAERAYADYYLKDAVLFDLYELGWSIADYANDLVRMAKYDKKSRAVSMVSFRKRKAR